MAFDSIEETVRRRLGHLVSEETRQAPAGTVTTRRHATFPIAVRRPADGSAKIPQFCTVCESTVQLSVASTRRTQLRRRAWLLASVIPLAVVTASVVTLARHHLPDSSVGYPGLIFGGPLLLLGLFMGWADDGISVARDGRTGQHRLHQLFPAKTTSQPQPRFRPVEMRQAPAPVIGAGVIIGLVAVAFFVDAISRLLAGAGPVSAPIAIFGALVSGVTALGMRRGVPGVRGFTVFWGLVFLVAALGHRNSGVWGTIGLAVAGLWVAVAVLVLAPASSRAWFRPTRASTS